MKYFDIACRRITEATKQTDLFIEKPKPPKQVQLFELGDELSEIEMQDVRYGKLPPL